MYNEILVMVRIFSLSASVEEELNLFLKSGVALGSK